MKVIFKKNCLRGFSVDRILAGSAANAISEVANLEKIDINVMGLRGRNHLAGLLPGCCTHRVLKTAPCPVLVIAKGSLSSGLRSLSFFKFNLAGKTSGSQKNQAQKYSCNPD
ncbi:MAG: universal stress protein [Deltaproteobacteria bacterium]|nr:universal stress protein [Deltaproteobacteria bacterium]